MLWAPLITLFGALNDCPAPSAVEAKLQSLRPEGATAPQYRLEVERSGETVLLTARDATGGMWLQRELPAEAPCGELEDAAAVVLLAWEAELAPGVVPVPEVPPAPVVERAVEAPSPPWLREVRVSAAGMAWLSSASPTWGAMGAVELRGRWLGVELGVLGQGQRVLQLAQGSAVWSRFSVALGVVGSVQLVEGVDASLGLSVLGGPFWAQGRGFDNPSSVVDFDFGVAAQAKVMLPVLWKVRPYVACGGVLWVRRHVVEARTPDAERLIPFLELSPTLGLSVTL